MVSQNILVLGAGELGVSILTALSNLSPPSTKVTVLLRPETINSTNPIKSKEVDYLRSLGIAFLSGDVARGSITELASLFQPYDTIISCLGFVLGPGSQLKIARSVLAAKVPRFIPWQFGIDYDVIGRGSAQDLFDEQLDVRDLLRSQDQTKWIIVSTGLFTSFLFEKMFGIVDLDAPNGPAVKALGAWDNKLSCTTAEDIGRLTTMIVLEQPEINNQVVYVAGDTVDCAQLVEIVERVTGKQVRKEISTLNDLRRELDESPDDVFRKYRMVFGQGKGVSWPLATTYNRLRGIEVTTAEGWAKANLSQARSR